MVSVLETYSKVLKESTINQNILNVEYAVRGELVIRADEIQQELENGTANYPFKKVINCNIGNPQQLGQSPITFFRQVASLTEYPELIKHASELKGLFPEDAVERAKFILSKIPSVGAYTHSQGIPFIRKRVAEYLKERDGFESNPDNIFLTTGASSGVLLSLNLLAQNSNVGVMIPIPQYPLYSAALSLYNLKPIPYYLQEDNDWSLNISELKAGIDKARSEGTDVRSLVIINPGNPTGQCLDKDNMKEIIEFCYNERLVLMADEVYQVNTYQPETRPFHSFKKILYSMDEKYRELELISFHSTSKGIIGECGRRGGFFELNGIAPEIRQQIYKISSISLCPNVPGQIMIDLMLNPPKKGDASYELYTKEVIGIYESLKRRAVKLCDAFNRMEGITCNLPQGAMYLFPQIKLSKKAIEAAQAKGKTPDEFYAMDMLNNTGVCVIPGSGFSQVEGTYHFRSTFLPPEDSIEDFITLLGKFHSKFMETYKD